MKPSEYPPGVTGQEPQITGAYEEDPLDEMLRLTRETHENIAEIRRLVESEIGKVAPALEAMKRGPLGMLLR